MPQTDKITVDGKKWGLDRDASSSSEVRRRGRADEVTGKASLRAVGGPALAAAAVAAFAVLCQFPASRPDPVAVAMNVLACAAFALVGVLIAREPRMAFLGGCLVLAGLLWASRWLYVWDHGVWPFLSLEGQLLFWVPATCAVVTYPTGRTDSRAERVFLLTTVVGLPVSWTAAALFTTPEWAHFPVGSWWPTVVAKRSLNLATQLGVTVFTSALAVALLVLLARRVRRASRLDRRLLVPVFATFSAAGLAGAQAPWQGQDFTQSRVDVRLLPVILAVLAVPLAFGALHLRRQIARAEVGESLAGLFVTPVAAAGPQAWPANRPPGGDGDAVDPVTVRDLVRRTLDAPETDLLLTDGAGRYWDVHGQRCPPPGGDRLVIPVRAADETLVGVLVASPGLDRHLDVVEATVAAISLLLENTQRVLMMRLRAQQAVNDLDLLVREGEERHQTLQIRLRAAIGRRLLVVAAKLGEVRGRTDDPRVVEAVEAAYRELMDAFRDIRDLAGGAGPAVLRESGLRAAIGLVAGTLPIAVETSVVERRFAPEVELAVYYTVSEALTNVYRHAGACRTSVCVAFRGDELVVSVVDDGRGGADVASGRGLTGLAERLRSVGGRFQVNSPPGGPTALTATVPVAVASRT